MGNNVSFAAKSLRPEVVGTASDRPDTTLENVRRRLSSALSCAEVSYDRLSRAADRAYGAEISGVGRSPEKESGQAGVVDEIFSLLGRLDAINSATVEQIERIERLV